MFTFIGNIWTVCPKAVCDAEPTRRNEILASDRITDYLYRNRAIEQDRITFSLAVENANLSTASVDTGANRPHDSKEDA